MNRLKSGVLRMLDTTERPRRRATDVEIAELFKLLGDKQGPGHRKAWRSWWRRCGKRVTAGPRLDFQTWRDDVLTSWHQAARNGGEA